MPQSISLTSAQSTPAVELDGEDKSWQDMANCLGVDPDLFFPERGASTREAKEVCKGCVVRDDCLEYALANGEKFGIWGGMSERERRRIRHGKWHIQNPRESLREQGFTRTGWPHEQNVRFRNLDFLGFLHHRDAFIVVMHRDREHLFRAALADDIIIQHLADLLRRD
jgi:WhiB family redox-sensing transcriptional regulator